LLHRRELFAGVDLFLLYDFFTESGSVNEDVYAFSNGVGNERALVIFHNKFADVQGWVRSSAGFALKGTDGERTIMQRTLSEGLNLHADPRAFCLFRDSITGLEYIRPSLEIINQGLSLSLHAYQYHVFTDIHEVYDDDWGSYRRVNDYLSGRGVPSVQNELRELLLQPVLQPLREILNPGYLRYLLDSRLDEAEKTLPSGLMEEAEEKVSALIDGIEQFTGSAQGRDRLLRELRSGLRLVLSLPTLETRYPMPGSKKYYDVIRYLSTPPGNQEEPGWIVLLAWVFLHNLGVLAGSGDAKAVTLSWFNEWLFGRVLAEAIREMGYDTSQANPMASALRIMIEQQDWFESRGRKP
ncbi:MAG: alpha-amylase, partial [Anaerolineaceae bacterium]|nr:alpha-amylase [Anaerolineaceae bacterium]